MCELLGVSCNKPVRANVSFKVLQTHAEGNPDGWGLAFYPDQSAQIFKEGLEANKSGLAEFVAQYEKICSKIFLCHIRQWSKKSRAHKNTHPFLRELDGKEYVFAHNGSLPAAHDFHFKRFHPLGDTDSECIFCYLMDFISSYTLDLGEEADLSLLEDHLHELNGYPNAKLNCLLSDGRRLLCYRDMGGHKKLLFLQRDPGYIQKVKLYSDNEIEFEFRIQKASDERAIVVATEPLTAEKWLFLPQGSLMVLEHGQIIYPRPLEEEEEEDAAKVEVYESPRFLTGSPDFPNVVSVPLTLRNLLGVAVGEKVRITNDDASVDLTVCKAAKELVGTDPLLKADHPERHICLPPKVRKRLHLEEKEYRNSHRKFKTKYVSVVIQKAD